MHLIVSNNRICLLCMSVMQCWKYVLVQHKHSVFAHVLHVWLQTQNRKLYWLQHTLHYWNSKCISKTGNNRLKIGQTSFMIDCFLNSRRQLMYRVTGHPPPPPKKKKKKKNLYHCDSSKDCQLLHSSLTHTFQTYCQTLMQKISL